MASKVTLKSNQRILFIGDSITDCGRREAAYSPFGFGYVNFLANFLLARYPHLNLNIINRGIGGNTIRDLKIRWERDCIGLKPDVLSILIGINDLWRGHSGEEKLHEAVYINEYESTYRELLRQVKEKLDCQVILIEPFMLCDDAENEMFKGLSSYREVVKEMAEEIGGILVPLQKFIDEGIKKVSAERWSDDMVHPHVWVHAWIAQQWFEITGI